jgi:hypothetical protein
MYKKKNKPQRSPLAIAILTLLYGRTIASMPNALFWNLEWLREIAELLNSKD